ncbi:MAG: 4,5-DOPA dioxygenase extradiol [Pyrinomonadaceae bacterium]|nr:4,5-DOPA dioxygenase extradiol [Pyrinomonadaceae bacterium]
MQNLLFVGHGNPMYAIEENSFTQTWQELGKTLPKPKAIVVISAHWETVGTFVTAMENPRTIHDFYGFPQALFDVQYNASGSPELAKEISGQTEIQLDQNWGLDHGTWSVLKHIYPKADIPVLQISLDRTKTPAEHFEFAKTIRYLRKENVLIIGSGNIVHNLRMINFRNNFGDDWANSANETLKRLVVNAEYEQLINYQKLGSEAQLAIPTPEHFLPLLYILALKNDDEKIEIFNDVVELGSISMTSFKV